MTAAHPEPATFAGLDEFCLWAETQDGVFELVDGRAVSLMTGATRRHNLLTGAAFAALYSALRDSGYRVYGAGQLVRTGARNGRSPDVLVSCGEESDERWEDDAALIVEVLSPSTGVTDLREKLREYQQLPSMRQYLVLHQTDRRAQLFTRTDIGWHETEVSGSVPLGAGGGIALGLDPLYDEVDAKLASST